MIELLLALVAVRTAPMDQTAPQSPPPPNSRVSPRDAPQNWVTNDDYPAGAIRQYEQGSVGFRLDIEADGRVSRCTLTRSSGWPLLDVTTCALLRRRARFYPATDSQGAAIPSTWSSRFTWRMPDMAVSPRASWAVVTSFLVDERGGISNCKVRRFGAVPSEPADPCELARGMPDYIGVLLHGEGEGIRLVTRIDTQQFETMPLPRYAPPAGEAVYRTESAFALDAQGFITACKLAGAEQIAPSWFVTCIPGLEYEPVSGGGEQTAHARYTMTFVRGGDSTAPGKSR
ncbi:energy transducer TonB [Sphingomonas sp.]|uniref:energy transducer TonB n=1 Tax=Sphingomonas sp. TaxID=28214 RepID=UPI001B2D2D5E|nr:energy transducer TonB [Sphingomonas sp.]MBO9712860.1 TonB family protein [Sphingomonas sp.]